MARCLSDITSFKNTDEQFVLSLLDIKFLAVGGEICHSGTQKKEYFMSRYPLAYRERSLPIAEAGFTVMVEYLIQWKPLAFGVIVPHDRKSNLLRLQSHLCLAPYFCGDVYEELTTLYQLTPTDIARVWIQRTDVSLGELHDRLWHEASMAEAALQSNLTQ